MSAISELPVRRSPQQLRLESSKVSIGHHSTRSNDHHSTHSNSHHSTHSNGSRRTSPVPSSRAIEIGIAFKRVRERSTTLQTALLETSVTKGDSVKGFQDAATDLFRELQHLPDDIAPTPVLISAIQGCNFQVHSFGSSAERYCAGCEWSKEQQGELMMMLDEVMASMCALLELATRAMEEAEATQVLLKELESDTRKAERGFGPGSGFSTNSRPLSWLVPVNGPSSDQMGPQRHPPSPAANQSACPGEELLTPAAHPNRTKYDIRHLREYVQLHHREDDPLLSMDSPTEIDNPAPFLANLCGLDAPEIQYNPGGDIEKAILWGLVEAITSGSAIERGEFAPMVLTTFRHFASCQNLADVLYLRYTEQQPERLIQGGTMRFHWSMAQKRVKTRIATVLHLWLELHWKPEDSGAIVKLQQLVDVVEEDDVFNGQGLRTSLDQIVKDKDRRGRRFREEGRYKPRMTLHPPTPFAARDDLAALALRNPAILTITHFTIPEGVVEFARVMTMVESRYYHKLSPENIVHYNSEQTFQLRKELGDFDQRCRAWIVRTITNPEDPGKRAQIIKFWFEVAESCIQYRNFNTAYRITRVLGDPEFEKVAITRQVLEKLDKNAIRKFWGVFHLYENDTWWYKMNSSSLPAIPVSHILISWQMYLKKYGLRGLYNHTRDFCFHEFRSDDRIDVGSFLSLADLIWDTERTYEPHAFVQSTWIENWFLAQVFASQITDFGPETRHLEPGVAKDNPVSVVPDAVLAELVVIFEAKLRRKRVKLIPLVPCEPSAEVTKTTSVDRHKITSH